MGSCQDNNSAQPDLGAVGLNPSPQNSLAFEFRNSVVYCRVGQLCLPSYPQQIPWAMLLHGPQDRDVLFVKKRNYSVYVVKVVIGANCAQEGPGKSLNDARDKNGRPDSYPLPKALKRLGDNVKTAGSYL